MVFFFFFFFSSRRRHTISLCDWSSDVCSSDLVGGRGRVDLRLKMGASIRLALRIHHGWRTLGGDQPPPRWTSGPRVALRVSGPPAARASFDRLWISPR